MSKRVLIAVNTLTSVGVQPYASHFNFAFRLHETGDSFHLFNGYRMSIDRFRNDAGRIALRNGFDYLLFLDDDVCIGPTTYHMLKESIEARENWEKLVDGTPEDQWPAMPPQVDIVTPVVHIRSYPFKPMFFKSENLDSATGLTHYTDWQDHCKIGDLLPVAAIGFSCCLLRVELLKKVTPAWFVTGTHHTEDTYFCIKAKQTAALRGEKVGIYVDTRLDSGHMMDPDFVCMPTRQALIDYYETVIPELKEKNAETGDNPKIYLAENKEALANAEVREL